MTHLLDTPPLNEPGLSSQKFLARFHNATLAFQTPSLTAETVTFACQRIVKQNGDYKVVETGELSVLRTSKNERPGRVGRSKYWLTREPKELLIELLANGEAYEQMLDADVWTLALRYCRAYPAQPAQTMLLSRALNGFLIRRAGGSIEAAQIP